MKSSGGDLVENGCFLKVKLANVRGFSDCLTKDGSIYILRFFNGGDVDENRHFIQGKLVAHGQISIFYKNLNDDVVLMMRVYRTFPY